VETTERPVPVYLPLEMHGWRGIEIVCREMGPLLITDVVLDGTGCLKVPAHLDIGIWG